MDIIKHTGSLAGSSFWKQISVFGSANGSGSDQASLTVTKNNETIFIGSFYNPNNLYDNFKFVTVQYDISSNLAPSLVGIDNITDSLALEQSGGYSIIVSDTTYTIQGCLLIHDNPDTGESCINWGLGVTDFLGQAFIKQFSNISAIESDLPPKDFGFGEKFETGLWTYMGAPDNSVTHANHTITWDASQRMKIVATGAGTSYFVWDFVKNGSNSGYITISDSDSATAKARICKSDGNGAWLVNQEGNGTKVVSNSTLSNNDTQGGIAVESTEACTFYVDRFAFIVANKIIDLT
jgi:hypothetical protein